MIDKKKQHERYAQRLKEGDARYHMMVRMWGKDVADEKYWKVCNEMSYCEFPDDCFCQTDTADIFFEHISFMDQPVAQLQLFITDDSELELYMEGDQIDTVMIKRKIPIKYCPFCGRDLVRRKNDE